MRVRPRFSRRRVSVSVLSVLSLSLLACAPTAPVVPGAGVSPPPGPSAQPSPEPSAPPASPAAGATPQPGPTATATPSSSGSGHLPAGSRLVLSLNPRFLSAQGQTAQLSVRLEGATGESLPVGTVVYVSSRHQDISVSASGLVTALVDDGYSEISAQVGGLSATQRVSVSSLSSGGSSGGGGGGGSPTPSATPTPQENVNVSLGFEGLGLGEFQVNSYTTGPQADSAVSVDADGNFVVVWQSNGQDGDRNGIYGQRYASTGQALGSEFQVNSYTTGTQSVPAVSLDADGDFVVVWSSYGQDGSGPGTYGQRYASTGQAAGSEFQVNSYTTGFQSSPAVSLDADGDFVVVWHSNGQDGNSYGVYGQRYASTGLAVGSEFQVNSYTTNYQSAPVVSLDADGDFVVVWQSYDQDGSAYGIYGQRYASTGLAVGSEFQVSSYNENGQSVPAVSLDADGDFVVVWQSDGQDGSGNGVYAKRYTSTGLAQ